jgi:uncharacterized protein (TIGR00290 family)
MIALSWSGGKDCARALEELRRDGGGPDVLMTTTSADTGRVTHHGVSAELLRRQAVAVGLPLVEIAVPPNASSESYGELMRTALGQPPLDRVDAVAFGDLHLADLRAFRERRLASAGIEAMFPLWGRDPHELAHDVVARGYEATIVSIDPAALERRFLGRRFDHELLSQLPAGVDPCGENGEFHTFVSNCPAFEAPVAVKLGAAVARDGFPAIELAAA